MPRVDSEPRSLPRAENPITRRGRLATSQEHGWYVESQQSSDPRDRIYPVEWSMQAELPIKLKEEDGVLKYESDPRNPNKLKFPAKFAMAILQTINGNPFTKIDAVGTDRPQTPDHVGPVERAQRELDHTIGVEHLVNFTRDAMRAVYKPEHPVPQPGGLALFLSVFPLVTNHIQDLWAVAHLKDLAAQTPILRHLPGINRIVPRPRVVRDDAVAIGIDLIPGIDLAHLGRWVTHLLFRRIGNAPFPMSVYVNRQGMQVERRTIEMYLAQSERRELQTIQQGEVATERQRKFVRALQTIIRQRPYEVTKLQNATLELLKKAGFKDNDPEMGRDFDYRGGIWNNKFGVEPDTAKQRRSLSDTQVEQIVKNPNLTAQERNNIFAGLNLLDALKIAAQTQLS